MQSKPWWNQLSRRLMTLWTCMFTDIRKQKTHTEDPALAVTSFLWVKNLSLSGFVCFNWMGGGGAGAWQSQCVGSWETAVNRLQLLCITAVADGVCRMFRQHNSVRMWVSFSDMVSDLNVTVGFRLQPRSTQDQFISFLSMLLIIIVVITLNLVAYWALLPPFSPDLVQILHVMMNHICQNWMWHKNKCQSSLAVAWGVLLIRLNWTTYKEDWTLVRLR